MNILVTGGDGFVGRHLCEVLAGRDHDLTVLSRTPDPSVLPERTTTVSGDVRSYDSIESAFADQDVVVNLVALSPLFQPPDGTTHTEVHVDGTRNVVRAMMDHDVPKLVQMSSVGTKPDGATGYVRAKGQAEWVVLTADIDAVIVRPNIMFGENDEFTNFIDRTTLPYVTVLPDGGTTPFQPLWVGDTAEMVADTAVDDRYCNEIYELAGPEELTIADVTRRIHRARGQSVTILPLPMTLVDGVLRAITPISSVPFSADQARLLRLDLRNDRNDVSAFDYSEDDLMTLDTYLQSSELSAD
ncbi:NAD-dependent epimerase/dehydratase family protein [Halocatena salina]|uniref:NAD(P)H-binding protein n=1 Tax=Halocatena salina TaxID=2934340 RepID=A0A8U0A8E0_9EURY|nr:NAD-dependent epimerase/dehydratase family protein [Halocatena salina]UPM45106.1 NAD(P)H-binding protein [Halocatena salina]